MHYNIITKDDRIVGLKSEPINYDLPIISLDSIPEDLFDGKYQFINGQLVDVGYNEEGLENKKNKIRVQRATECFKVVNRGTVWYNRLTSEQKAELDVWYDAWLEAPETLVIPDAPAWLTEL